VRPSRRDFLETAASLAGTSYFAAKALAQERRPEIPFPSTPLDRLSVTSYPFRAYIESPTNRGRRQDLPGMDVAQFAVTVAEKFDVHNVNPLGDHFPSTDAVYIESFRKTLVRVKSHIVDLGLSGGHFYSPDSSVRQAAVDSSSKWIDIAEALGAPSVRQHVNGNKGEKPNVELAAESLGRLAEHGAKRNIVVNLENDNPIAEDPFFLVQVIEKVNNPYLRALPDFGNSLPGHGEAFNEKAMTAMFKHVFNMVHVKDTVGSGGGKTQPVDLKKMFAIAKASGYRGYFSMEFETESGDPFTGTKRLIDETLTYLT
jgi:sugar phosphate isomerase/epimerase